MSKDCLISELKGNVNNDSLPVFGKIKVTRVNNEEETYNRILRLRSNTPITITSNDVSSIKVGGVTQDLPYTLDGGPGVTDLGISWDGIGNSVLVDKYDEGIIHFEIYSQVDVNLTDLKYLTGITIMRLGNKSYGDIKNIASMSGLTEFSSDNNTKIFGQLGNIRGLTSLTIFHITNCHNISGSVADIATFTSISNLRLLGCNKVTGDISGLGGLTSIESMVLVNSGITGELEGFVANQVKAGRTTASLTSSKLGNKITFNGSTIPDISSDTIKWKPTTSSVTGAVTDVMSTVANIAITIDADGNKVADAAPW